MTAPANQQQPFSPSPIAGTVLPIRRAEELLATLPGEPDDALLADSCRKYLDSKGGLTWLWIAISCVVLPAWVPPATRTLSRYWPDPEVAPRMRDRLEQLRAYQTRGGDRFSIKTPKGFGGTIEQELLAHIAPEEMALYNQWMLRGLNNREIITWLRAVKKTAVGTAFQVLLAGAERELSVLRWQKIQEVLSEGALVA